MNEYNAMLRAICAEPDEDTPRLAYADWLDENAGMVECRECRGEGRIIVEMRAKRGPFPEPEKQYIFEMPDNVGMDCPTCSGTGRVSNGYAERAEFIRVQCELARLMPSGKCPQCNNYGGPCDYCEGKPDDLRRREGELWNASRLNGAPHPWFGKMGFRHYANWWTTYDKPEMTIPLGGIGGDRATFNITRGFVSSITLPCAVFMRHARPIFESQPVTRVVVTPSEQVVRESVLGHGWIIMWSPWTGDQSLDRWVGKHAPSGQYFESEELAMDGLSEILVAYSRSLANLPPLRRAEPVTARGGAGVLVNEREG
jgi:uncharacterized protein (TIGR02996 family)